jgi:hypothetical protein
MNSVQLLNFNKNKEMKTFLNVYRYANPAGSFELFFHFRADIHRIWAIKANIQTPSNIAALSSFVCKISKII